MLRFFLKPKQLCAAAIAALLITMTACTGEELRASGGEKYAADSSVPETGETSRSGDSGREDASESPGGETDGSDGISDSGEKTELKGFSGDTGNASAANAASSVDKASSKAATSVAASSKAASSKVTSSKAASSKAASSKAASSKAASSKAASSKAASSKQASTTPGGSTSQAYQAEVIRLTNLRRQEAGLPALKTGDARLQAAANIRAAEIVQSFSHTRPNGSSTFTVMNEQGVNYRAAGENIAYGQTSPAQVMEGWMNSSGHRANILNSSFDTICVGHVVSGSRNYWVQLFIKAS